MNKKMTELKSALKQDAQHIRNLRKQIKEMQRNNKYAGDKQCSLLEMSYYYRHHHIAYSELRGRTREQIETPNSDNLPSEHLILKIKEEYAQDVCTCEA